ncbi:hypothetical protein KKH82_02465 [Patescibacteria group bacterium]|nr:hypothetical protein [Patescibacteria group bacterium]
MNSNGELNVNFENGVIGFDVKFLKNEEYRVTVEDDGENVDDYKIFDVG